MKSGYDADEKGDIAVFYSKSIDKTEKICILQSYLCVLLKTHRKTLEK